MIYLIGGAPRSGKSKVAKKLLKQKNIPWLALDFVRDAINFGVPKLDLLKLPGDFNWDFMQGKNWWPNMPKRFYPFLEKIIEETHGSNLDYLFEGDCFLPEQVIELSKKFPIKSCFLGSAAMTEELLNKIDDGGTNWHRNVSNKASLAEDIQKMSAMFQQECLKHNIIYFDTSSDHERKIEEAYSLIAEAK